MSSSKVNKNIGNKLFSPYFFIFIKTHALTARQLCLGNKNKLSRANNLSRWNLEKEEIISETLWSQLRHRQELNALETAIYVLLVPVAGGRTAAPAPHAFVRRSRLREDGQQVRTKSRARTPRLLRLPIAWRFSCECPCAPAAAHKRSVWKCPFPEEIADNRNVRDSSSWMWTLEY